MESLTFTTRTTPTIIYKSGKDEYEFSTSSQMFRPATWNKNGVRMDDMTEISRVEAARANYVFSNKIPVNFVAHAGDRDGSYFWDKEILFKIDHKGDWRLVVVGSMGIIAVVDPPFPKEVKEYLDKKKDELLSKKNYYFG